ncbi:hypothetical protein [Rossellomorea marisflavi]|uniref:hypothetical protein n=1 Tax=Rossellomorea marisflavi TaxID=189381 RepID=UPI001EE24A60|nr:hypothetical protein [Rossellomorea marisflavi]UKS65119.1 hypothetical protein K6T23_20730 [Rossellomorea marisflavi]
MKRRLSALDVDQWGMKSVSFRCGRLLSSGSESSLLSCASGVSSIPLFPKESVGLRCIALCG